MRAINFEEIEVGDKIIVDLTDMSGDSNYTEIEVRGIDKDDHSIISNLNGGWNIHPNEDDQYIVTNR